MIICVEMSRETKTLMDSFVGHGDYKDYAELIASALMNLSVLRSHMTQDKALILDGPRQLENKPKPSPKPPSGPEAGPVLTPDLFQIHGGHAPSMLAALPPGSDAADRRYLPQEWLFGQYNKLLPVKATCRAIRSLLEDSPEGVDLAVATAKITDAAVTLRQMLVRMDAERRSGKGESLAAGFPSAEEKARLRFANQFVGSSTRAGAVSGFPADLKLIGIVNEGRKAFISLTQAGWDFTNIENPILDHNEATGRLAKEEATFLLRHINAYVPSERAAYVTILRAVTNGSATPDDLDIALREFVGGETEITDSHLATQRAGAVARMIDLGLIGREKSGLFVRYFVKDLGNELLESAS